MSRKMLQLFLGLVLMFGASTQCPQSSQVTLKDVEMFEYETGAKIDKWPVTKNAKLKFKGKISTKDLPTQSNLQLDVTISFHAKVLGFFPVTKDIDCPIERLKDQANPKKCIFIKTCKELGELLGASQCPNDGTLEFQSGRVDTEAITGIPSIIKNRDNPMGILKIQVKSPTGTVLGCTETKIYVDVGK